MGNKYLKVQEPVLPDFKKKVGALIYARVYSNILQNAIFFLKWCPCYRSKLNSGWNFLTSVDS